MCSYNQFILSWQNSFKATHLAQKRSQQRILVIHSEISLTQLPMTNTGKKQFSIINVLDDMKTFKTMSKSTSQSFPKNMNKIMKLLTWDTQDLFISIKSMSFLNGK